MTARLKARGRALGEGAAAAARKRIAERVMEDMRGISARVDGDEVVLSGRGLRARLLREPVLRWIGSLMR